MSRTQSTPRKVLYNLKQKRFSSASPSRTNFLPEKLNKLQTKHESIYGTPTKVFAMDNLDASLNHYFSPKKKFIKSPCRIVQRQINFDAEENFSDEENQKNINSISQLQQNGIRCNLEELIDCFSNIDSFLPENLKTLEKQYEKNFLYWKDLILIGQFNILFYGLGKKEKLLNNFLCKTFYNFHYVIIYCFKLGVNCCHIFDAINTKFKLNVNGSFNNLTDWALKLRYAIENSLIIEKLILSMHNIDAFGLRSFIQQEALSILAQSFKIHIIATVDHVNTTLLWKQETRDNFNWVLVSISTFQTYGNTLLNYKLKSLGLNLNQNERSHSFASLDVFWQAASQKMRKILQTLALFSENPNSKNLEEEFLTLSKLCKILKQNFATTNEAVLRQQLSEFIDLCIIKIDKKDNIQLLVNKNLLISFLESKNEV